ncbi:MAG: hypothetical protein NXH84_13265 [Rhodobacteraceae bacterium]|jgi:hypothetical protein|nr:hypothetical protein [Paracoccaceae bacterium]
MLLATIAAVAGALIGALVARRRKGALADILQYAAVYAVMFALAGLFAAIIITRVAG